MHSKKIYLEYPDILLFEAVISHGEFGFVSKTFVPVNDIPD